MTSEADRQANERYIRQHDLQHLFAEVVAEVNKLSVDPANPQELIRQLFEAQLQERERRQSLSVFSRSFAIVVTKPLVGFDASIRIDKERRSITVTAGEMKNVVLDLSSAQRVEVEAIVAKFSSQGIAAAASTDAQIVIDERTRLVLKPDRIEAARRVVNELLNLVREYRQTQAGAHLVPMVF